MTNIMSREVWTAKQIDDLEEDIKELKEIMKQNVDIEFLTTVLNNKTARRTRLRHLGENEHNS